MKRILFLTIIILFLLKPLEVFPSDYETYLPGWIKLLQTGNEKEKKLALKNLWILKYAKYRKDSSVFDPVFDALKDKDPYVREAAVALLKRIGEYSKGCCKETNIIPSLIEALEDDNPRVKAEAAKALAYYKDKRAIAPLIKSLKDGDPWVKLNAVFSLGYLGEKMATVTRINGIPQQPVYSSKLGESEDKKIVDSILELLKDNSDWRYKFVQQECIVTLRKLHAADKKVISLLTQKYNDDYLKIEIIKTLGKFRALEAKDIFIKAMQSSDKRIRKLALEAMLRLPVARDIEIGKDERLKLSISLLKDSSEDVRAKSVEALGSLRDERAVDPLIEALHDESWRVKASAIKALKNFNDIRILDALIDLFGESPAYGGRNQAAEVFLSIAEKTFEKRVYVYRKDNTRQISEHFGVVRKGTIQRIIHPVAVDKLINAINKSDSKVKLKVLQIIHRFEDERIEPALIKLLNDPSNLVRRRAANILTNYGNSKAVPALIISLQDQDASVRAAAAKALGEIQDKRGIKPLIEKLNDNNDSVKKAALNSLGQFDDPRVLDLNIKLLKNKTSSVKVAAIQNIQKSPDIRAVEPLVLLLNDSHWSVASNAAVALGVIRDKRAVEPLISTLNDVFDKKQKKIGDVQLQKVVIETLGRLGDKRAVPALIKALDDERLIITAIKSLGLLKDKQAVPDLMKFLNDEKVPVRQEALLALGEIGDPSALGAMKELLDNEQFRAKHTVIEAIGKVNDDRATEILIDLLNSPNNSVVDRVIILLGKLKKKRAIKPLVKAIGKNKNRLWTVATALRKYENPEMVDILIGYLKDTDIDVKKGAILLSGEFRDQKAVGQLKAFLEDSDIEIRTNAKNSINRIKSFHPGKFKKSKTRQLPTKSSSGYGGVIEFSDYPRKKYDKNLKKEKPPTTITPSRTEIDTKKYMTTYAGKDIEYVSPQKSIDIKPLIFKLGDNDPKVRRGTADKLGDIGNREAVKHIIPLLKDEDEYVRQAAARALGKLKDKKAVEPLIGSLKDRDEYVRAFSVWALGEIGDKRAIELLVHSLQDKEDKVRDRGYEALRKFKKDPVAIDIMVKIFIKGFESKNYLQTKNLLLVLSKEDILKGFEDPEGDAAKTIRNYVKLMESSSSELRKIGAKGLKEYKNRALVIKELSTLIKKEEEKHDNTILFLRQLKDPECLPVFVYILENRKRFSSTAKRYAIDSIGGLDYKDAVGLLLEILNDSSEYEGTREAAARALGKLGGKKVVAPLINILKNKQEHKNVMVGTAVALGAIRDKSAVEPLISILINNKEHALLRVAAASALGNIGDERAIKPLEETMKDPSGFLRHAVGIALRKFK